MSDELQASIVPREYWDDAWATDALPRPLEFATTITSKPVFRHVREFLLSNARGLGDAPHVIEVGCGASVWLPYLAKTAGWRMAGIDYSKRGCALAQRILEREAVQVPVHCSDVFEPPRELVHQFDAALSFGVAEHFVPTQRIIEAIARLIRPGGVVMTIVPNMAGWVGSLQRMADKALFEMHVPLTPDALAAAHRSAGLEVIDSRYLATADFYVVNETSAGGISFGARSALRAMRWISKLLWLAENAHIPVPVSARLSPYVACAARRPH